MKDKSAALLAILVLIMFIVIIAIYCSYNCVEDKCGTPSKKCNSTKHKKAYSPEIKPCNLEDLTNKSCGSVHSDECLDDPWEKHRQTMKEHGYNV